LEELPEFFFASANAAFHSAIRVSCSAQRGHPVCHLPPTVTADNIVRDAETNQDHSNFREPLLNGYCFDSEGQ
jgi:hypothetical protein